MKNILTILLLLSTIVTFSQVEKGNIILELGFGVGGYNTEFEIEGFPVQTDGAAPGSFFIAGKYAIGSRFALGLNISTGRYLQDEEDRNNDEPVIGYGQVAISLRGMIVNGEKFQVYTDLNLTSTASRGDEVGLGTATGGGIELIPGINYYFGKAGIFYQLGFAGYNQSGEFGQILDYNWKFSGFQSRFGASIKF